MLRQNGRITDEDIRLWQLEDGSYTLDISEYGFYNTVHVIYSGGVVTESYYDLVRVYGEVAKTYNDKTLTKTQAQAKAKAYLSAHLQDFGMEIKCSILHNPDIEIGDIVTLENPLTLKDTLKKANLEFPEFLFVKDIAVSWEADGIIKSDLVLAYSPEAIERDIDTQIINNTTSDTVSADTKSTDQTESTN